MFLMGEFRDKDQLIAAIRSLKSSGTRDADLDIFSEEPVELRKGILDRPTKMSLVAVLGGGIVGVLLTLGIYLAQNSYKVVTGGMPIFSPWATGVISFEMTMLGSVLISFGWFLWESGLIRKRDRTAPVPLVEPGSMCLRVRCEDTEAEKTAEILRTTGAIDVEEMAAA
jgi:hypothetical protein